MTRRIAMFDPGAEGRALGHEVTGAVQRVLASGRFVLGPEVEAFETEFARYVGVRHVVGVGNGFDALYLALRALGIGPGDEVLTVPNTAFATAVAITNAGAKPVFVDVDATTFLMDLGDAEAKVTDAARAVLPVDLFGLPVDPAAFRRFAAAHGLVLIEDACQAHGAAASGVKAGAIGDAAAFSFYPTKNLGAYGDGGALATDDDEAARTVRLLRHYGQRSTYEHVAKGVNSRLDEIHAAVLRAKLPHIDRWNAARRAHAARYREAFDGLGIAPAEPRGAHHVYHQFVVRVAHRDRVVKGLAAEGIETQVHYPTPIHLTGAYADLGLREGTLPVAEGLAREVLSIPVHPFLSEDDVERVARTLTALVEEGP